jgi:metal-responsive CopG/Arc/MetJ family transcriptional regulator
MAHVLTRTHVIAPKELIEEVDRIVGPRRRSEFITDAVAEKLKREKLLRLTREVMKLPSAEVIPEWATPESTAKWLRDGRADPRPIRKV